MVNAGHVSVKVNHHRQKINPVARVNSSLHLEALLTEGPECGEVGIHLTAPGFQFGDLPGEISRLVFEVFFIPFGASALLIKSALVLIDWRGQIPSAFLK